MGFKSKFNSNQDIVLVNMSNENKIVGQSTTHVLNVTKKHLKLNTLQYTLKGKNWIQS